MDINKYLDKIDYYIDKIKDIDINSVVKINLLLEKLKLLLYPSIELYVYDIEDRIKAVFAFIDSLIIFYKNNKFDSVNEISEDIISILNEIILERNNIVHNRVAAYNTDSYYKNIIKTLNEKLNDSQEKINSLEELNEKLSRAADDKIIIEKEISELQKKLELTGGANRELEEQNSVLSKQLSRLNSIIEHYNEEKEKLEILQKENDRINDVVRKYETELEKSKQREDAINNWKNKISAAFQGLKGPINKLQQEHDRLKNLYRIYGITSIALVILLIVIEIIVCCKINSYIIYPTWEEYWTMVLPVPVAIGLLWGFITQMNRAQRQMVVLARQIYEIEYIEGLLQALNTLSVNIEESMSKINEAISHLIDNHLRNMDGMRIDETVLQKLEKQDALPYEKIPELIKLINKA